MALGNIMIRRRRLIKLAEELSDCRVLYVQASAGCGKTVFAEQWLESRRGPAASVTLDEYDNTAEDLCRKLKNVLEELGREESWESVCGFTNHPDFDKAPLEFLMRAEVVIPKDSRASVVIDDLHYLTDLTAQKVMKDFLSRLPAGIKICMLSRSAPPESFSGLYLKNELRFITQEQMLFDVNEVCTLFKSKDTAVTKRQAETILAFTEGWPIGIGALLLSEGQLPAENKPQDWLESFLKSQVWEAWDEESRKFMLDICMEDELSESLCNALTGREDSHEVLERLMAEGAFLSRQRNGTYRFHRIFREFLRKRFIAENKEYKERQIRISGEWYMKQKDFYHASERFSEIKDYVQIASCFDLLEQMDRAGFDAEHVMRVVRNVLDEEIAVRYPYLFYMMAYTARNEGKCEEFMTYADQYYHNYPRIVERNPELAHNIFFLYTMDFRFTLQEISKMADRVQTNITFQGVRGSATLYFPFYHRSYRDFSEILPGDIDERVAVLDQTLGGLLGEERVMLIGCIRAGLYYEQGRLQQAQEAALLAAAKMQQEFAPESKFCAMMLLLSINHALQQAEQEEMVKRDIQQMIERDKVFYLQYNFDAVATRNRMYLGDTVAAGKWLEDRGSDVYGQVDFLRLTGHFTTAKALLTVGNYDQAVILLNKILEMCQTMNRPADVIEADILLAAAFWKKKRGSHKKALYYLEDALKTAQPLGYEQLFINEGAELEGMLSRLKTLAMRSDYAGCLSGIFVKKLYIRAAEQTQRSKSPAGTAAGQSISFTKRQKQVMKLMCEGYSYRKIAEKMDIKFSTVRSHIELIYRKLDVSDMKEAILKIRRLHILDE